MGPFSWAPTVETLQLTTSSHVIRYLKKKIKSFALSAFSVNIHEMQSSPVRVGNNPFNYIDCTDCLPWHYVLFSFTVD